MAAQDKVANRYAQAILDSLGVRAQLASSELKEFALSMETSKELKLALGSRIFSREARKGIVADLCGKMKLSDEARRALGVICDADRLRNLNAIAERLQTLLLEASGVIPLKITTATDVPGEEKKALETRFTKLLGSKVAATYELDASLIGGVRVVASGKTYDGSIVGWLNGFEEQLVGGNI